MRYDPTLEALARIERKLDLVMQHLEIRDSAPPQPDPLADVRELARRGKTIQAIKAYRERTGVGLKEAKEAVERLDT
ncbi:ribosomal protein L7/L12 [Glycomyces sp. NPDC048151]|uniref:ribosomal protein L7/L12 n=1 Tax=Glycomyces sp. NPDC048151 TaxID=3364002 RepID=UPI00371BB6A8